MVKLLAPRDNALFMASWRERMRPASVFAAAAVSAIVITLVIVGCYMGDEPSEPKWPGAALALLGMVQGIVLLLVGSFSAGQAAARERTTGTLDFHRTSPTGRTDQVLGLIIGAPCLEWCIFAGTFPVTLVLCIMSRVRLGTFVEFTVSLVVAALFFHSMAVALGLWRGGARTAGKGSAIGALPVVALFIVAGIGGATWMSSLYHAANLPSFEKLFEEAFEPPWNPPPELPVADLLCFYHVRIPSIILQLMVQAPFAGIAFVAARRMISRPDRPALSKLQSLACVALVAFLVLGGGLSVAGREYSGYRNVKTSLAFLLYFALAAALWAAWIATPTRLLHVKGLRRMRKLGRRRLGLMDDHASNMAWLAACLLVLAASFAAFVPYLVDSASFVVAGALIVMGYVAWFAGGLELFSFSRYRAHKSLFGVAVAIPWLVMPTLGLIGLGFGDPGWQSRFLLAMSPLTGIPVLTDALVRGHFFDWRPAVIWLALPAHLALSAVTLSLAARERRRAAREEVGPPAGDVLAGGGTPARGQSAAPDG